MNGRRFCVRVSLLSWSSFSVLSSDVDQVSAEGQTTGLSYMQFFIALNWEHDLWPACRAVKINTLDSRSTAQRV